MDRNDLQLVHNAPKSPFGVIDAFFGWIWWVHLVVFEPLRAPKTAKEAKMGRISAKRGFSGALMQHANAGKVHLCTLPVGASNVFF